MHLPDLITEGLGRLAYEFARVQPLLPTYGHLLLSAIFPIFAGSFASLSRPSSAAKPEKKGRGGEEDLEDEEEEEPVKMEGLSPSDAILFPILAGVTLTGLYFLIKWLQDPALLNKILNWYFATFSVFSVSRLVSDGLDVLHSFLFPHDYVDSGVLFHVEPKQKQAVPKDTTRSTRARTSPLPGILSRLPLPQRLSNLFWTLHVLPTRKLTFSSSARGFGSFKLNLGIHGLEGLAVGLSTVLYYNLVGKPWYLTNLMGFGFAYGALQLMSPTTFTTGTMLLGALLCYDFYMVFRTPMMVTVAKSLDIPIKLLFPRPPEPDADPASKALSMLGLGDIVLPGIMIGLALRFDLYLHYFYKQSHTKTASKSDTEIVKAPYIPVSEAWGDRFWTTTFLPGLYTKSAALRTYRARNAFPKPYFYAGLSGYLVGMLSTLAAMQISAHPQPALIYLVPGVLIALWGTALVRGEIKQMYKFSDAGDDEEEKKDAKEKEKKDKADEKEAVSGDSAKDGGIQDDAAGKEDKDETEDTSKKTNARTSIFSNNRAEERSKQLEKYFSAGDGSSEKRGGKNDAQQQGRTLFSFSITAPPAYWPEEDTTSATSSQDKKSAKEEVKEVSATPVKPGEHIEKRRRIA